MVSCGMSADVANNTTVVMLSNQEVGFYVTSTAEGRDAHSETPQCGYTKYEHS